MPTTLTIPKARRRLERAAIAWSKGVERLGAGARDMDRLDARLFDACGAYHRAVTSTRQRTKEARA